MSRNKKEYDRQLAEVTVDASGPETAEPQEKTESNDAGQEPGASK